MASERDTSLAAIVSRVAKRLEKTGRRESEVLKQAGLSRDYLRNFRRSLEGKLELQSPKIDGLQKLADALGTTFGWLVAGVGSEEGENESPELRAVINKLRSAPPSILKKTEKFIDMLSDS